MMVTSSVIVRSRKFNDYPNKTKAQPPLFSFFIHKKTLPTIKNRTESPAKSKKIYNFAADLQND